MFKLIYFYFWKTKIELCFTAFHLNFLDNDMNILACNGVRFYMDPLLYFLLDFIFFMFLCVYHPFMSEPLSYLICLWLVAFTWKVFWN